jgi:hypothetical protein
MVLRDLRLKNFVQLGLEVSARPLLVCLAEVRVASDVGDHHRGKSALHVACSRREQDSIKAEHSNTTSRARLG